MRPERNIQGNHLPGGSVLWLTVRSTLRPRQMQFLRRILLLATAVILGGCATPKNFDPKDLPPVVPLQDAPPGKAIVYLLRAPHDKSTLPVFFDAKKVAVLGPATYTVTVVAPGSYQIASSPMGRSESMPASSLTVKAGERRFLYVSAPTSRSFNTSFMFLPNVGVVPLVVPTYGPAGAKTWKECSELDAQGFISISRPVQPEPGAA